MLARADRSKQEAKEVRVAETAGVEFVPSGILLRYDEVIRELESSRSADPAAALRRLS